MDTFYFFASKKDLCNIFEEIERQVDIKYYREWAYQEINKTEKPPIEFNTIEEIADNHGECYLIGFKNEKMKTFVQKIESEDRNRYGTLYRDNNNCVVFAGGKTWKEFPDTIGDYQIHVDNTLATENSKKLFKIIVNRIKHNCILIKDTASFYIGKDLYKVKERYVFYGMCFGFPKIITETGEAKRWWRNKNVRDILDKPLERQFQFLQEVFENKRLQDFEQELKNRTEDYEIYEAIMYKLLISSNLLLIEIIVVLFNDTCTVKSPLYISKSAMEELKDIVIDLAFSQKVSGLKLLLENIGKIPYNGYKCGSKAIIITLLKKKYFNLFMESLECISYKDKEIVKRILADISDKKLLNQVSAALKL